jgi:hypothetical protein
MVYKEQWLNNYNLVNDMIYQVVNDDQVEFSTRYQSSRENFLLRIEEIGANIFYN